MRHLTTSPARLRRVAATAATLFAVALLAGAGPASPANLLVNPAFDGTLAGWALESGGATLELSPSDGAEVCGSHSARVSAPVANDAFPALTQCVPVTAGQAYDLAAWVRIDSSDPEALALLAVAHHAGPSCAGDAIGGGFLSASPNDPGRFSLLLGESTAPPGAGSAKIYLTASNETDGLPLAVHFDEAALCPDDTCGAGLGPEISSPEFPDFRFYVRIAPGSKDVPGRPEPANKCVQGTVCVSGALAGRTEVMLRIIGPRADGHLWFQAVRFTPSRVVIVVHQLSTDVYRTYLLAESTPDERPLSVEDRDAFLP